MKNKLTGWKDIFRFTLIQTLKSKAFIVSFVILVVLALAASPVINMINKEGENSSYTINKLYVSDETGIFDTKKASDVLAEEGWSTTVKAVPVLAEDSEEYTDLILQLAENEKESALLLIRCAEGGPVSLYLEYPESGKIENKEAKAFTQVLSGYFERARFAAQGITDSQQELLAAEVITNVLQTNADGDVEAADTSISSFEYWFLYALLFIIMMICMMSGSQVATAIVTEKSSKVVEYLLTSVRPLAIIVGKVLAMLCVVLTEVGGLLVAFVISNQLSGQQNGENMLAKLVSPEVLSALNPLNIIICFVFIGLGLVFYATLAGLAGATVSRMEEAGEGLILFSFSVLVGVYVGMGAAGSLLGSGDNAFALFAMLFPLSSPFLMPGAVLIGKAELWVVAAAFAILLVLLILLFAFVARVYEALIVYNGNRVGIRQLFKMR